MNRGELPIKTISLLACGLCLGLFSSLVLSPSESSSGSEELRSSIQELGKIVTRLDSTLARLNEAPTAQPFMSEPSVLRSSIEDDSITGLIRQLESLENALSNIPAVPSLTSAPQAFPPTMTSEKYPQNLQALMDLQVLSEVDVAMGHLNWTYGQILSKFGSPTFLDDGYDNGHIGFVYSGLPSGGRVWVDFFGGRVVSFSTGWSE